MLQQFIMIIIVNYGLCFAGFGCCQKKDNAESEISVYNDWLVISLLHGKQPLVLPLVFDVVIKTREIRLRPFRAIATMVWLWPGMEIIDNV